MVSTSWLLKRSKVVCTTTIQIIPALLLPFLRQLLALLGRLGNGKGNEDAWTESVSSSISAQDTVDHGFGSQEKAELYWWQATGLPLVRMLQQANYDFESQQSHLQFHSSQIVPRLGPEPRENKEPASWRSFVTDSFFPLEYSWSWNKGCADPPKVRYTVELIGSDAGSMIDPHNRFNGLDAAHEIASRWPNVDLTWLLHFFNALVDSRSGPSSTKDQPSQSTIFLAFDFHPSGGLNMKAYLIPLKKSDEPCLDVVSQAIRDLEHQSRFRFPAYDLLRGSLSSHPIPRTISVVGLGIDCVEPGKARLRLYVRSTQTSFNSVCEMLSLNGRLPTLESHATMSNVRKIWDLLLSTSPGSPSSAELPGNNHETGGILYSFDVKPQNSLPEPKLYIPIKHYARSDGTAFDGLEIFLRDQSREQWIEKFRNVLDEVGGEGWKERRGMLTYVGVGLEREDLSLTTYFAPRF